jgi:group II intron reverse transcriptase/maturase
MDISKYFDTIDHELMLKAVEHVMEEKWVLMYVKRWLEMPIQKADGTIEPKAGKGTPQGGVISPLLANLYLHFTFDKWMEKRFPEVRFVRYADDIIIHCQTEQETEIILTAVKARLEEVKLSLNEEKTHTAYCKDYHRLEKHENVKFEFLGMSYQPRPRKSHYGDTVFMAYSAEISRTNQKRIRDIIKGLREWRNTTLPIKVFAKLLNPKIRGWIDYYGKYSKKILKRTLLKIDERLIKWLCKKHKMGYRGAVRKLKMIKSMFPKLFHHWEVGY